MKLLKNIKHRKIVKKTIKVLAILLLSITLLSVLFSAILSSQQEHLQKIFVNQLNSYLVSKVEVEKIEVSFIRTFPMAAIHFNGVKAHGSNPKDSELLLELETVSLKFSVLDIFRKNYEVRQIVCNNGYFNIKLYEDESDNFHIIKPTASTDSNFAFSLQKIIGKNCLFKYIDLKSGYNYQIFFSNLYAKGNLNDEEQDIKLAGNYVARSLKQRGKEFIINKQGNIDVDIFHKLSTKTVSFSGGRLSLDGLKFKTIANICYKKGGKFMNMEISGDKIKIDKITTLISNEYADKLKEYKCEGIIDFDLKIKGDYSLPTPLRYQMAFQYNNGEIEHLPSKTTLKSINIKGKYDNGKKQNLKSSTLILEPLSAILDEGKIEGYFSISNLEQPYVVAKADLDIDLEKLNNFLGLREQQLVSGNLKLSLDYKNKFSSLTEFSKLDFIESRCRGEAKITDFDYYRENPTSISLHSPSIQFTFTNKNIEIVPSKMFFNNQELNFESKIDNIFPYLFLPDETLLIQGKLNSPSLNMTAFLDTSSNKETAFSLPDGVFANLDFSCDEFQYKNIELTKIEANLLVSPGKYSLSNASMQAFGGDISANIDVYKLNKDLFQLTLEGKIDNVNLSNLLKSTDNFGQENITHENISGILSNDIKLYTNYSSKDGFDKNSLVLWTKMNISQGELINLKGLEQLSKFTGENDLKNLKFADLNNTIQIENGLITIPLMEINTNLLGIKFAGTHSFTNEVNYDLFIELSEVLSLKRKKKGTKEEDLGFVDNKNRNKLILPVHITGNLEKPVIAYDFKNLKFEFKTINPSAIDKGMAKETQNRIEQARWKEQEKGKFLIDFSETETDKNYIPTKATTSPTPIEKSRKQIRQEEEARRQSQEFKISFEDD